MAVVPLLEASAGAPRRIEEISDESTRAVRRCGGLPLLG